MSQRAVEGVLGRLITDAEFRFEFFRDPAKTCRHLLREMLTPQEMDALMRIDPASLSRFEEILDPKIVRAVGVDRLRVDDAA